MNTDEIKKAKKGDKDAFELLIMSNIDYLYRVAFTILKNETYVEDALQSTVLISFEKIHTLRKEEFFKTWLTKILINECNKLIKKEKKIIHFEDMKKDEVSYVEEKDTKMDIKDVIRKLDEDLRELVNYYYIQDKKVSEIADILNIPEGTVKSRLARARSIMANMLGGVFYE